MSNISLYIRDRMTGEEHRIGDDIHDMIMIDERWRLHYTNLQNGDGCVLGERGCGYEFIPNMDDHAYNYDPRKER